MSVFKKLKDVLFDIEEDDEIPVIEKTRPVIEKNPIKEVVMPEEEIKSALKPRDEIPVKKEPTFNFPLDLDDDDFEEPVLRRPIRQREIDDYEVKKPYQPSSSIEPPRERYYDPNPREEKRKAFKPSPVISPVYGVLDQNYTKDDVIIKTDIGVKGPSIDDVRKKAFPKEEIKKVEPKITPDEPIKTIDDFLEEEIVKEEVKPAPKKEISLEEEMFGETIEKVKEKPVSYYDEKSSKKVNDLEDTLENDLFNLIDSMYEDKEEEE